MSLEWRGPYSVDKNESYALGLWSDSKATVSFSWTLNQNSASLTFAQPFRHNEFPRHDAIFLCRANQFLFHQNSSWNAIKRSFSLIEFVMKTHSQIYSQLGDRCRIIYEWWRQNIVQLHLTWSNWLLVQ